MKKPYIDKTRKILNAIKQLTSDNVEQVVSLITEDTSIIKNQTSHEIKKIIEALEKEYQNASGCSGDELSKLIHKASVIGNTLKKY